MTDPKQVYVPPEIIIEEDIEANAGISNSYGPATLDPLEAEVRGMDWPVESDFLTPKE